MFGLAAASAFAAPDLDAAVGSILDRRLNAESARPVAVALSGGGDSLALLIAAHAWATRTGRRLIVLTVDHRLRPEGAAWTAACAATAARLGLPFRALTWQGDKPATGLPAAARAARHRLLADAAREAGAAVILLGHTADDVAEARRMRAAGGSVPEPREWGPSPAWPEGRGVFLLRPMLGVGRADIRAWLDARGETWIDDPANDDLRFARARARRAGGDAQPGAEGSSTASLALATAATSDGGLEIARQALCEARPDAARRFVAAACLCAAGTVRPPAVERAARLAERLAGPAPVVATLAGARIEADAQGIRFVREAGEAARGGLEPLSVRAGAPAVWDGRFEVAADRLVEVRALAGLAGRLPRDQQSALRGLPPAARRALPAIVEPDGAVACPLLADVAGIRIRALAYDRLLAACGAIEREPA